MKTVDIRVIETKDELVDMLAEHYSDSSIEGFERTASLLEWEDLVVYYYNSHSDEEWILPLWEIIGDLFQMEEPLHGFFFDEDVLVGVSDDGCSGIRTGITREEIEEKLLLW